MPRFSPKDIDAKIRLLRANNTNTTAAMLDELMTMLRQQEYRLHIIERAVDDWSSTMVDDRASLHAAYEDFSRRLQEVQEACPWDDANEEDSWFFSEEEAMHPVRIRED